MYVKGLTRRWFRLSELSFVCVEAVLEVDYMICGFRVQRERGCQDNFTGLLAGGFRSGCFYREEGTRLGEEKVFPGSARSRRRPRPEIDSENGG